MSPAADYLQHLLHSGACSGPCVCHGEMLLLDLALCRLMLIAAEMCSVLPTCARLQFAKLSKMEK